jgi:hypothetical protein
LRHLYFELPRSSAQRCYGASSIQWESSAWFADRLV